MSTSLELPVAFDIRALSYLTHVDENLCCPICHSPLIDPITTKCRHTFCSECIINAFKVSKNCPVDRTPLEPEDITMAPVVLANLVDDLTVLCPNSELGCTTSLPRGSVKRHLKDNCDYISVKCPGADCDQNIMKKDVSGEECVHKDELCPYCSSIVRKLDMKNHEAQCPGLTMECRHCHDEFSRSTLIDHEATCDEAIIPCGSASVGCPWHGQRKETADHATSCPFSYLRPILEEHATRIASLEQENKALRRRVENSLAARALSDRQEASATAVLDDQTLRLLTEQEHIRTDVERLYASMQEMDIKQNMYAMHINENMRIKEDVAMIGAAVNNLRTQLNHLQILTMRRQDNGGSGPGNRPAGPSGPVNRTVENVVLGHNRRVSVGNDRVKL